MTFYSESFFLHQQQVTSLVNYIAIVVLLLLLIFTGLQITNLERTVTQRSQSLQMRPFIQAVAKDHGLKPSQVVVNSTTLTDGILVRFKGKDYRVNMSPSGDNYTLTRAHVVDHTVNIQH